MIGPLSPADIKSLGQELVQSLIDESGQSDLSYLGRQFVESILPAGEAELATKDLAAPPAEAVFDQALVQLHRLERNAQKELLAAFKTGTFEDFERARAVVEKYIPDLVRSLTETELNATLAGMRRVAERLPGVAFDVPFSPPLAGRALGPAAIPQGLGDLIDRIRRLPAAKQDEEIAKLAPAQAAFVRAEIAEPPPPPWVIPPGFGMPEEPIIRFPLIEYAARDLRLRQLLTRPEFDKLAYAAKEKAFTVAQVESRATLGKIRDLLAAQVSGGPSLPDFREKVKQTVGEGTFLSPWHMELVYRQNVQQAYATGMDKVLDHPMVVDAFPYEQYVAIHDDRVRPDHLAMETRGIQATNIFRRDDPVWAKYKPPWDFG